MHIQSNLDDANILLVCGRQWLTDILFHTIVFVPVFFFFTPIYSNTPFYRLVILGERMSELTTLGNSRVWLKCLCGKSLHLCWQIFAG